MSGFIASVLWMLASFIVWDSKVFFLSQMGNKPGNGFGLALHAYKLVLCDRLECFGNSMRLRISAQKVFAYYNGEVRYVLGTARDDSGVQRYAQNFVCHMTKAGSMKAYVNNNAILTNGFNISETFEISDNFAAITSKSIDKRIIFAVHCVVSHFFTFSLSLVVRYLRSP